MNCARRILFAVLLVSAWAIGARAQTGPAVTVTELNCKYPLTVTSLSEIDFANLTLQPNCVVDPEMPLALRGGKMEWKRSSGGGTATLDDATVLPGKTASETRAIITFTIIGCGASCSQRDFVQVFALFDGHPTITQQLSVDSKAVDTGATLNTKRRTLRMVARSDNRERLDVAYFVLSNGKFELKRWKQVPIGDPPR